MVHRTYSHERIERVKERKKEEGEKKQTSCGVPAFRAHPELRSSSSGRGLVRDTKGAVLPSPRTRVAVREEIMDETNKSFSPLPRHEGYRPSEVMSNCPGKLPSPRIRHCCLSPLAGIPHGNDSIMHRDNHEWSATR